MQEARAYEEGYRDGLRFIFTISGFSHKIPKEIWEEYSKELRKQNQILKDIRKEQYKTKEDE